MKGDEIIEDFRSAHTHNILWSSNTLRSAGATRANEHAFRGSDKVNYECFRCFLKVADCSGIVISPIVNRGIARNFEFREIDLGPPLRACYWKMRSEG
jgi:hypothetical protein